MNFTTSQTPSRPVVNHPCLVRAATRARCSRHRSDEGESSVKRILYSGSVHDQDEKDAVMAVLDGGVSSFALGENVAGMERSVAALFGKSSASCSTPVRRRSIWRSIVDPPAVRVSVDLHFLAALSLVLPGCAVFLRYRATRSRRRLAHRGAVSPSRGPPATDPSACADWDAVRPRRSPRALVVADSLTRWAHAAVRPPHAGGHHSQLATRLITAPSTAACAPRRDNLALAVCCCAVGDAVRSSALRTRTGCAILGRVDGIRYTTCSSSRALELRAARWVRVRFTQLKNCGAVRSPATHFALYNDSSRNHRRIVLPRQTEGLDTAWLATRSSFPRGRLHPRCSALPRRRESTLAPCGRNAVRHRG